MTDYDPSYAARAHDLCMVGLSELEISQVLGISVGYLRGWREHYEDFNQAWVSGVALASVKVVGALHKRACGYDKLVWRDTPQGMMQELKHIEANIPACVFWLTNKHPDQWKTKVEHEGPSSGNLLPVNMSDTEAARSVAFALAQALYNQSRGIENGNADVQGKTE